MCKISIFGVTLSTSDKGCGSRAKFYNALFSRANLIFLSVHNWELSTSICVHFKFKNIDVRTQQNQFKTCSFLFSATLNYIIDKKVVHMPQYWWCSCCNLIQMIDISMESLKTNMSSTLIIPNTSFPLFSLYTGNNFNTCFKPWWGLM